MLLYFLSGFIKLLSMMNTQANTVPGVTVKRDAKGNVIAIHVTPVAWDLRVSTLPALPSKEVR